VVDLSELPSLRLVFRRHLNPITRDNDDDLQRNAVHDNNDTVEYGHENKCRDKPTVSGARIKRCKRYPRIIGNRLQDGVQHGCPNADSACVCRLSKSPIYHP